MWHQQYAEDFNLMLLQIYSETASGKARFGINGKISFYLAEFSVIHGELSDRLTVYIPI